MQVFLRGHLYHIIDGCNEQQSNWMRYVNQACAAEEQNLVACQNGLDIFFYTITPLRPGQELLVWYCSEFAQRCNLPPLGQLTVNKNGKCVCNIHNLLSLMLMERWFLTYVVWTVTVKAPCQSINRQKHSLCGCLRSFSATPTISLLKQSTKEDGRVLKAERG